MAYLCNHGEFISSCKICSEFRDELEFLLDEMDDVGSYNEYLYDHYLELDEKVLREEEE